MEGAGQVAMRMRVKRVWTWGCMGLGAGAHVAWGALVLRFWGDLLGE